MNLKKSKSPVQNRPLAVNGPVYTSKNGLRQSTHENAFLYKTFCRHGILRGTVQMEEATIQTSPKKWLKECACTLVIVTDYHLFLYHAPLVL